MPLDWTEWRSKLIAIDYPNAASLDEQTVMQLLFRPSAKRKTFITWISRKIVASTGYKGTDLLSIFSSFVFGTKETLNRFIEGIHSKDKVMENILKSILDDLRPMSPICGDRELRRAILLSGTTTMSAEQLGLFGITGPPPNYSFHQPDILDRVDEIVNRAEAIMAKHSPVVPPSVITPCPPDKPVTPLAKLVEDARNLNIQIESNHSLEGVVKRNEAAIAKIRDGAVDLEEFVDQLKNMAVALKSWSLPESYSHRQIPNMINKQTQM